MLVSDQNFAFVVDLVRREASIELPPGKEYLVASRLNPLARELAVGSVDQLVERFRRAPSEKVRQRIVESLTTNETLFFRDTHPFECLREDVIPALARRSGREGLRILSAACSTGQEPYTLAMLLAQHFPQECDGLTILATDLNEQVLERARLGRYSRLEVTRGLPSVYLAKYFRRAGADWEIRDELKKMVNFRRQNVAECWPEEEPFDLILLRNVLMYFSPEKKRFVLHQAATRLSEGGALLLGATENILGLDVPLLQESYGNTKVYVRAS